MYTQEEYNAKRQARYERLLAASIKAEKESTSLIDTAHKMTDGIPFGQPILIGHHSEKRDRNYRGRIENKFRKGFELYKHAQELASRAESAVSNDAIYSDDPSAVDQLANKVAELKAQQTEMKRINAALRKGADFATLEMSEENRAELLVIERCQGYYQPLKRGFPPYMLTSLSTKIRNAEKRAAQVGKKQALQDSDYEVNGVKVEGRPGENRIRLNFGKRVSLELYNTLRHHGFRACKEEGIFSAYYNNNAIHFVKTQLNTL